MKFLKTVKVDEFRNILTSIQAIVRIEELVALDDCFNRVVSRNITSNINVPHFRKSQMDGYAVIAEDTFGAEEDKLVELELIEKLTAGETPKKELHRGQCSYVATGAALPNNSSGVVMVEFTEIRENEILISTAITPGTHVIDIGHDVKSGTVIVEKDTLIDIPMLGVLATCGVKNVPVYKKPIISLMSTGNELVSQDIELLEIGKIYDVNSIMLKKAISNTGVHVNFLGVIKDDYNELKKNIDYALKMSDIVIISGGTSKGEGDLGPEILKSYSNIDVLIHGVKIKPGKPLIFAKLKEKLLFILPGYPTSALSCFYIFIDNFLRKLSGYPLREKNSKEMELGERIYSTIGRYEFKAVKIQKENGYEKIFPIKTGSEAISTMLYADGYIEIDELESMIDKGEKRIVYFF